MNVDITLNAQTNQPNLSIYLSIYLSNFFCYLSVYLLRSLHYLLFIIYFFLSMIYLSINRSLLIINQSIFLSIFTQFRIWILDRKIKKILSFTVDTFLLLYLIYI